MDPIFDVLVLARWLHFGAMFALFGGAVFRAYMPRDATDPPIRGLALRYLRIAAPIALVTGAIWLAVTIVNMTGDLGALVDPDTLHAFFFQTSFGPIEETRLALLVILAVVVFVPIGERPRLTFVAIVSGTLLVSQAWLGHAAEGGNTPFGAVMIVAYAAHVLAGAAWLGGLPPLLGCILESRRRAASTAHLLSRYSLMATFAVCLILITGVANSAFRVAGRFGALWPTRYGTVLLVKLAFVGLMLAFAAYNRFVAIPRLRVAEARRSGVVGRIDISITCEIVLGALVLAAAAMLGVTPPPAL